MGIGQIERLLVRDVPPVVGLDVGLRDGDVDSFLLVGQLRAALILGDVVAESRSFEVGLVCLVRSNVESVQVGVCSCLSMYGCHVRRLFFVLAQRLLDAKECFVECGVECLECAACFRHFAIILLLEGLCLDSRHEVDGEVVARTVGTSLGRHGAEFVEGKAQDRSLALLGGLV